MIGDIVQVYILEYEDLVKIKYELNKYLDESNPQYIHCLTDILFDEDDFGHSCYMLLDLDPSEDEAEMEWWKNEMPITDDCGYWFHYNRARIINYIRASAPNKFTKALVHISY